ncbi:GNAT family N-acetyltransferase [Psittacicella hinzii]|uniref:N-acetyltransferase domain-containing protein n=1 Tax=Psittacicella hinzii TaxID=2028575 RepID=A0A3A1YR43_9GAMM|nr:GNAT family N-acetyltransferase [Psittacicella hinzii]RIY38884.1 hypothetical protein CKF58_03170 [Psittacicella hinzii]
MKEFLTSVSYPFLREDGVILVSQEMSLEPLGNEHLKPMWTQVEKNRDHLGQFLFWAKKCNKDEFCQYIETAAANFTANRERHYAIVLSNKEYKHQIIGSVSLVFDQLNISPGVANLGYYLFQEFCGKGYMHEALQALCAITYTNDLVERFELRIHQQNLASKNVALKLNAKYEGELRNFHGHTYYQFAYVLPDDFIQQNQFINDKLANPNDVEIAPFDLQFSQEHHLKTLKGATEEIAVIKELQAISATNNLLQAKQERNLQEANASLQHYLEQSQEEATTPVETAQAEQQSQATSQTPADAQEAEQAANPDPSDVVAQETSQAKDTSVSTTVETTLEQEEVTSEASTIASKAATTAATTATEKEAVLGAAEQATKETAQADAKEKDTSLEANAKAK